MLEVTDVENRHDQLDIRIVAHTVHIIQSTGLAECVLLRRTLSIQMNRPKDGQYSYNIREDELDAPAVCQEHHLLRVLGLWQYTDPDASLGILRF